MASLKNLFMWSGVLKRTDRSRAIRLPGEGGMRLSIELMQKHPLNSEYLGDLRVSGRNGGAASRRR
ncbi:MAG: hypothetical protein JJU05_04345 [Verrucomicrobia bacterium]|nr:hypothetical protein [Verrucomicrobiota bacterium]MCH8525562.1 hypothetical protein [Kiritimatiellia bacterium]